MKRYFSHLNIQDNIVYNPDFLLELDTTHNLNIYQENFSYSYPNNR